MVDRLRRTWWTDVKQQCFRANSMRLCSERTSTFKVVLTRRGARSTIWVEGDCVSDSDVPLIIEESGVIIEFKSGPWTHGCNVESNS